VPAAVDIDLYAVLGVARSATSSELRRAYRRLALVHHPDRAGAASAPRFAQIADAYRVLSNPLARSTYDATLADRELWRRRDQGPVHSGGVAWDVSTNGWQVARPAVIRDLLPRLSGRLADLTAGGVACTHEDGTVELTLNTDEARTGGTAALVISTKVTCATCGGVASPRGVWCRTCGHEGAVVEELTTAVTIPVGLRAGARLDLKIPRGRAAALRVRVRVAA
jgi:DnaJ-class molecular chaperone